MQQLNDKQTRIVLFAIVAVSFAVCLFFLFRAPELQGQDAAYYLLGTESILKNGFLPGNIIEWPPVFFYFAALFSFFAGSIAGIKIAAALFTSLAALSVFLLAKKLFKSNETALVSALFVFIAPVSMRLLNGFWKTSTAVFLLPLFFYFFFSASGEKQQKKNLAFAFAVLLLLFLSHKLAGMLALLVLLAFAVFQLVFERKTTEETRNSFLIIAASGIAMLVFFALAGKLLELAGFFGLINAVVSAASGASLWQYYSTIVVSAFFGALYCFFKANRGHLFLLSWLVIGLFVSMPLTSGDNYWRFAFLLALPFSLLSGVFFSEIKKELGSINSAIVFVVVALLALQQFNAAALQLEPIFSNAELEELRALKEASGNSLVLARGPLLQWLQYSGANAAFAGENFLLDAKQHAESGEKVFLVLDRQRSMLDYSVGEQQKFSYFTVLAETKRFLVSVPDFNNLSLPAPVFSLPNASNSGNRFASPVLWLFFPAELFNSAKLPFNSVLRAIIGLPLSLAFIAFLLSLAKRFEKKKNFRFACLVFAAFLVFLTALGK